MQPRPKGERMRATGKLLSQFMGYKFCPCYVTPELVLRDVEFNVCYKGPSFSPPSLIFNTKPRYKLICHLSQILFCGFLQTLTNVFLLCHFCSLTMVVWLVAHAKICDELIDLRIGKPTI